MTAGIQRVLLHPLLMFHGTSHMMHCRQDVRYMIASVALQVDHASVLQILIDIAHRGLLVDK